MYIEVYCIPNIYIVNEHHAKAILSFFRCDYKCIRCDKGKLINFPSK